MSISAPPSPPPMSTGKRATRPVYLIAAMVVAWIIGVHGLSESFATLLFLREGNLPHVEPLVRGIKDAEEPFKALGLVSDASYLRAIGLAAKVAFPLATGKLLLSVLLVISSGMAMSGRPGARLLAIQALVANAVLAIATFWLLRDARYAWIDMVTSVRETLPHLPPLPPTDQQPMWLPALDREPSRQEVWAWMLDRNHWLWVTRLRLGIVDVGALLLAAIALSTTRTKAYFNAIAKAVEQAEDP